MPDQTRDALQQADNPSSLKDAVNGLEAAATGVQKAASAQRIILANSAMQLVAACQEYREAYDAMASVQRAATERMHLAPSRMRRRHHRHSLVPVLVR